MLQGEFVRAARQAPQTGVGIDVSNARESSAAAEIESGEARRTCKPLQKHVEPASHEADSFEVRECGGHKAAPACRGSDGGEGKVKA